MASAEGGRGAASAPQAQGQRGGPARGAEGGQPWDRDWGGVADPLGEETLPLVGGVYGMKSAVQGGRARWAPVPERNRKIGKIRRKNFLNS